MTMEREDQYWCGICNDLQQARFGMICTGCGMKTATWNQMPGQAEPRSTWNMNNGFPPDWTRSQARDSPHFKKVEKDFNEKNMKAYLDEHHRLKSTPGGSMSTQGQARFNPEQVEAFAAKLKVYIRTLDDYDSQVTSALLRLGDTFDDDDYQDLCAEFARAKVLLRMTIEASEIEIPRIEARCEDVRANQSVRIGG